MACAGYRFDDPPEHQVSGPGVRDAFARSVPQVRRIGLALRALRARRARPQASRWLERVMGIEPTLAAWEADVLPLNDSRQSGSYVSLELG